MASFDLHVHSRLSPDSLTSPERAVRAAVHRGLSGLAFTDHDRVGAAVRGRAEARRLKLKNFLAIQGTEVRTIDGELLGLFVNEAVPRRISVEESLDKLEAQDAVVVWPHPCDRFRHSRLPPEMMKPAWLKRVHAIETFNARVTFASDNQRAESLAAKHKKAVTGGSDAHFSREIGAAYTACDARTEEELRQAIKKRKTKACGTLSHAVVHIGTSVIKVIKRTGIGKE